MKVPIQKTERSPQTAALARGHGHVYEDRRPEALFQRKLKRIIDASALPVIQRITINMDVGDNAIDPAANVSRERERQGKYGNEVANPDARIYERNPEGKDAPLKGLNPGEPIHIVAHGVPSIGGSEPMVGGLTPVELFKYLCDLGWTNKHTGQINLSACTTSWGRRDEKSFAKKFLECISKAGFSNTVTGYESFTMSVNVDKEEEVKSEQREEALGLFLCTRLIYILGEVESQPKKVKEYLAEVEKFYKMMKAEVALQINDPTWKERKNGKAITDLYMEAIFYAGNFIASPDGKTASMIAATMTNLKRDYTQKLAGGTIEHTDAWVTIEL